MEKSIKKAFFSILITLLAVAAVSATDGLASAEVACSYYASPNGGGNGLSQSSPFKIANFWNVARPGKTLCLLDGAYSDSISPPQNLNGTASARITVRALNDGKVRIDGGGVRTPVSLANNDYFVFEGFDVHNSRGSVVHISSGADYNIVRRVCAWNAADDTNSVVWTVHHSTGNLLEDVCGFGSGRKIYSSSQYGNNLTIRRAWGRWERSIMVGPKMVYSLVYNSFNATYENVIGTWDESAMGGVEVNQPFGILSMDRLDPSNKCVNSRFLGSIGYVRAANKLDRWLGAAYGSRSVDCLQFKDVVLYLQTGSHNTFLGQRFDGGSTNSGINAPNGDRRIDNVTEIGGTSKINTEPVNGWQISNLVKVDTVREAPSIWNGAGSKGARVCKRYANGKLTDQPLWPWPMNQRIIDAMRVAGKTPVDVTKTMEEIFGPIPNECRGGVSTPSSGAGSLPDTPLNLNTSTGG